MNILKSIKNKFFSTQMNNPSEMDDPPEKWGDKGNLSIKNHKVFLDGRELDVPSTSNIIVSQRNGKILVNGKEPLYKEEI